MVVYTKETWLMDHTRIIQIHIEIRSIYTYNAHSIRRHDILPVWDGTKNRDDHSYHFSLWMVNVPVLEMSHSWPVVAH